ncbi:WbqC family protein [Alicyclobacillus fodiniaquatilis]|uniref:WbqC family protein n=1 Tax=Alicyclobacillus fodiniaquatilis TaxID=1661150 RepID=A0ABW4JFB1_9BACL
MKVVTVVEPYFLPWLGYLHRLLVADTVVMLDHVKFPKRIYCNRVQVYQRNGPTWLSVPIRKTTEDEQLGEAKVADGKWKHKMLNIMKYNYCTLPYFDDYFPRIREWILGSADTLMDLDLKIIHGMFDIMGLDVKSKIVFSSQMGDVGKKNEMNKDLVQRCGGNVYYSGTVARNYNDASVFKQAGILLAYHNWEEPDYAHRWGQHVKGMSSIDALFHLGPDVLSRYLLRHVEQERDRLTKEWSLFHQKAVTKSLSRNDLLLSIQEVLIQIHLCPALRIDEETPFGKYVTDTYGLLTMIRALELKHRVWLVQDIEELGHFGVIGDFVDHCEQALQRKAFHRQSEGIEYADSGVSTG